MWPMVVETVRIFSESAPYLLIGFGLAGLLHVLISRSEWLAGLLKRRGSRSVVLASLLGAPLPLCSCSVLPAALALRKKGASKGATVSFLISVPETDVVSILMTYGLLGPMMAVYRPVAAVITAIVTGQLTDRMDGRSGSGDEANQAEEDAHCHDAEYDTKRSWLWNAGHFGFVNFFDDIIGSLLFGIVLGGIITALLPSLGITALTGGSIWSMLAMLLVGIPMYVCASASTPIAVGLIAGGVSPGAAMVFLLAGPATNMASLVVLHKHLGRRTLMIYLLSIAAVSLVMGLGLDAIIGRADLPLVAVASMAGQAATGPVGVVAAVLFAGLCCLSLIRVKAFEKVIGRVSTMLGVSLSPRLVKFGLAVLLLLTYVGSGFAVIQAGERGVIKRFGKITKPYLPPGLYYHLPVPFGSVDSVAVGRVRRIELGFRSNKLDEGDAEAIAAYEAELAAESWMLTGNENFLDIKWVVQYQAQDSAEGVEAFLFGVADHQRLLRDAAESAIRSVAGGRHTDTMLTTERGYMETAIRDELLQPMLDRSGAGIEVVSIKLLDVHAPVEVHGAFRDIASAVEDKETSIHLAHEYSERVLLQSDADAARRLRSAEADAIGQVDRAHGSATAFTEELQAYRAAPLVTQSRMLFELVDAVYPKQKKYISLIPGLEIDWWRVPPGSSSPSNPGIDLSSGRSPM